MTALLESAEFWTSFAFVLVVGIALRPMLKRLRAWGQRQAETILASEDQAKQLFQKAKALKDSYNTAYQNREQERKKAFREADKKSAFLEQEIQTKTQEKIHHKKLEVALRIQNIQENEQQEVKTKLISRVIQQAQEDLKASPPHEDTDRLTASVCQALDRFKSALN